MGLKNKQKWFKHILFSFYTKKSYFWYFILIKFFLNVILKLSLKKSIINLASFFYYESYIGLDVKWKVHNGSLVLQNLKYIF